MSAPAELHDWAVIVSSLWGVTGPLFPYQRTEEHVMAVVRSAVHKHRLSRPGAEVFISVRALDTDPVDMLIL